MKTNRISITNSIKINSILFSSIFQIGDINILTPRTSVLAVQREVPIFLGNEGNFAKFPLFSRPIPKPKINEPVPMHVINHSPVIKVNRIKINSISASSIVQIGSTNRIDSEARVKHIRQILRGKKPI